MTYRLRRGSSLPKHRSGYDVLMVEAVSCTIRGLGGAIDGGSGKPRSSTVCREGAKGAQLSGFAYVATTR